MVANASQYNSPASSFKSAAYLSAALLHPPTKQVMSCSGTYEKLLKKKALKLEDCAEGLKKSVLELRNSSSELKRWNNIIAVARIVQISCDLILVSVSPKVVKIKELLDIVNVGYSSGKAVTKAIVGQFSTADALMLLAENKAKVADLILGLKGITESTPVGRSLAYAQAAKEFYEMFDDWKSASGGLDGLMNGIVTHLQKLENQLAGVKLELQKCGLAI